MELKLDTYSFRARLAPLLLAILPAVLAVGVWVPVESDAGKLLGSVSLSGALTFLLAQLGRDQGWGKQAGLFEMWGGKPTTRMLRHSDSTIDPHTKSRYHRKLQELLPAIKMPSARAEKAKPAAADAVYESCVKHLLELTRDRTKYPLIFEANVSYGFRRNYWAMKPAGIANSTLGIISSTASIVTGYTGSTPCRRHPSPPSPSARCSSRGGSSASRPGGSSSRPTRTRSGSLPPARPSRGMLARSRCPRRSGQMVVRFPRFLRPCRADAGES